MTEDEKQMKTREELQAIVAEYENYIETGTVPVTGSLLRAEAEKSGMAHALTMSIAGLTAYRDLYLIERKLIGDYLNSWIDKLHSSYNGSGAFTSERVQGWEEGIESAVSQLENLFPPNSTNI